MGPGHAMTKKKKRKKEETPPPPPPPHHHHDHHHVCVPIRGYPMLQVSGWWTGPWIGSEG